MKFIGSKPYTNADAVRCYFVRRGVTYTRDVTALEVALKKSTPEKVARRHLRERLA